MSSIIDRANSSSSVNHSANADHHHDSRHHNKKLHHQLDTEHYRRIDEEIILKHSAHLHTNAIHGALSGPQYITLYEIYQKAESSEVAAIVHIGEHLCGHPGIVHGGIISALFDNTFGWLFFAMKQPPAFTANLNINYRKPILANTTAILRAHVKEIQVKIVFPLLRFIILIFH